MDVLGDDTDIQAILGKCTLFDITYTIGYRFGLTQSLPVKCCKATNGPVLIYAGRIPAKNFFFFLLSNQNVD